MNKAGPQVASIHTHFNIFRNIHDAKEGEVTIEEQITAMGRHVRWHERQVKVGQQLLAKLEKQQEQAQTLANVSSLDMLAGHADL